MTIARFAFLATLATVATSLTVTAPASAAGIAISGFVYHDKNNNGVKDVGEPGVPGVRVHHGANGKPTTTTDANGQYSLSDVPQSGSLLVETGWFRSQCNALSCAVGPGADNDFQVANQVLKFPVTASQGSMSDLNVGVLPDWPNSMLQIPAPVGGVVPSNAVDIAARLSGTTSNCIGGALGICQPGSVFNSALQIHNQGTSALTGIQAKVFVPVGDCVTAAALMPDWSSPGITSMTVSPDPAAFECLSGELLLTFAGSLTAAGLIRVSLDGMVNPAVPGEGTPGCQIPVENSTSTCSEVEPQGRGWIAGISRIDQTGDPDSVGFCAASGPQNCATGIHDKRREPDEIDVVGHNVFASSASSSIDLRMNLTSRKPEPTPIVPGTALTVRAWVTNVIDGSVRMTQAHPGASVTLLFPKGSDPVAPASPHAIMQCSRDLSQPDADRVTCAFRGPLSPYVGSAAIDVTFKIPAGWASTTYKTVACVTPVAGQDELVPAGASCLLTTDVFNSPTNNDAAKKFTITLS